MRVARSLEVWKLGAMNYLQGIMMQEKAMSARKGTDILLSLRHSPAYKLGKRPTIHNLLVPESELKSKGAELHYRERGGDVTSHGLRQAIPYPILSLLDIGPGARKYVENLELTMTELASLYCLKDCAGKTGETGVRVGGQKVAQLEFVFHHELPFIGLQIILIMN
ncbi:hypothetical protein Leryth_003655 [Lithospermum erythrorhizon]|nr:hypothetical protein Leryth_003655 [Lithospermum erythrorhizon]